jgi:hypothetical protein
MVRNGDRTAPGGLRGGGRDHSVSRGSTTEVPGSRQCIQEQPIRDIADYQDQCWWAGNIPADRSYVLIGADDETWLQIRREQEQLASDGTDRSRVSNWEGGATPSVSLGEPRAARCSSDSARRTSSGMKRDRATNWLPTKGLGGYLYAVGSQTPGPEGTSIG